MDSFSEYKLELHKKIDTYIGNICENLQELFSSAQIHESYHSENASNFQIQISMNSIVISCHILQNN